MRFKTLLLLASLMVALTSCGTRAILVQPGETLALATQARVEVYVPDDKGLLVKATADLPPGTLIRTPKPASPTSPVIDPTPAEKKTGATYGADASEYIPCANITGTTCIQRPIEQSYLSLLSKVYGFGSILESLATHTK